jgi:hypothetical protein
LPGRLRYLPVAATSQLTAWLRGDNSERLI